MWTRKDAAEIAETEQRKRRKRFSPLWPLLINLGLALVEWIVRENTARSFFFFMARARYLVPHRVRIALLFTRCLR